MVEYIDPKRCELTAEGHRTDYDRKQAIVHGLIRYRDIFGKDRWTTYGFYVSRTGRLERMADFPEYNKVNLMTKPAFQRVRC